MGQLFFNNQSSDERKLYIQLLSITGSLSNLFTVSENPFLYYRLMENIFCKAFNANNFSRSDISADAGKDRLGIGLKTFLHNNGATFQKIAEFNRESYLFKGLSPKALISKVSDMRNERILATMRMCSLEDMIYHVITRKERYMGIFEEHMDLIDTSSIKILEKKATIIRFTDNQHEYTFNLSKSTLLKRFFTKEKDLVYGFNINILKDPFEFLLSSNSKKYKKEINFQDIFENNNILEKNIVDYIILPLYSSRDKNVPQRSGLNQWNAGGRKRAENEVYIPIPSWIHVYKPNFFPYNNIEHKTNPFSVVLPNKKVLSVRVTQEGGKALMSNPNQDLGRWILRDVLRVSKGELVTKETLDVIGIDSVQLSKLKDGTFTLDFLKTGSFEEFYDKYRASLY
ncbi:restriction endonuclease PLD domain-containing protein [Veillonella criceti]|uniref:NgoFVII restriction endonuclease n=1 Tax=Veillonella criceti TaxID=103891 RepID=A0A380NLT1_9FIRM|nr:restriction endonuclease PLD domain-containing protein [Veillonella criceti]SUP43768.1 NgoFVII restriction endonuclease [Veillonella criceti]